MVILGRNHLDKFKCFIETFRGFYRDFTRANKGAIIISRKNGEHDPLDLPPHQLRNLVRGIVWRDEHFDGMSIENIAAREGLSKSGVRKVIMGSFDTLMAL